MSTDVPEPVATAFDQHEAYERSGDRFALATVAFDGEVTVVGDGERTRYLVTVHAPTIQAATADHVGDAVVRGWLETLERRLAEAPKATRASVALVEFDVEELGDEVRVEYTFEWGDPGRAAEIAKTFVEYVEGTYVEGIVPGYEYEPPVSDLIAGASQGGEGGTPL